MERKYKSLSIPFLEIPRSEFSSSLLSLEKQAIEIAKVGYAPYSNFKVGVALELTSGKIILGSNQENIAFPSGLCAERTALFYAGANFPNDPPKSIVIVALSKGLQVPITPCGACRQVFSEISSRYNQTFQVIMIDDKKAIIVEDNRYLLPFSFEASF